ncbi:MAG TPA: rhamnulokinase [Candidatus Pullichristensenella excrementipullorum]|nr:rhamnulokinase [Candidatus Pullichristensenella excrementipullorum]
MNVLGIDLGASSGRAMLGTLEGKKLTIREIHRFLNEPVTLCGRFVWDMPRLFHEIKQALLKLSKSGETVDAIGIDTWGVDFGLLDKNGHLLSLPVHYRDARTNGIPEKVRAIIPDEELFARTGIAFNSFNTLYQLYAMKEEGDPALESAQDLLFLPDLLAYFLTGKKGTEYTIASTSQLLDPFKRDWDRELMEKLGIPAHIFGEVKLPGTVRGTLLPEIAKECGVAEIPVIAIGGHDTASAVAAVPAQEKDFAYISSGTWSLLGAEVQKPLCTEGVMKANYTNEGGVDGSIRLLKNIMGLWIIQECKREWDRRGSETSFGELVELSMQAPAFKAILDVDDACFLAPGDMPARIQAYCAKSGQPVPEGKGEISRVIYESLALKYRWAIERLEEDMLKKPIEALHIVGGGSKNALLNRFTAEAIKRPVIAGPDEGTIIGNLLVQAQALGAISGIRELREVVENSFPTKTFLPETDGKAWDEAYQRYLKVCEG